eukprot:4389748-Pleurochrysis_carterae.AAC.1
MQDADFMVLQKKVWASYSRLENLIFARPGVRAVRACRGAWCGGAPAQAPSRLRSDAPGGSGGDPQRVGEPTLALPSRGLGAPGRSGEGGGRVGLLAHPPGPRDSGAPSRSAGGGSGCDASPIRASSPGCAGAPRPQGRWSWRGGLCVCAPPPSSPPTRAARAWAGGGSGGGGGISGGCSAACAPLAAAGAVASSAAAASACVGAVGAGEPPSPDP